MNFSESVKETHKYLLPSKSLYNASKKKLLKYHRKRTKEGVWHKTMHLRHMSLRKGAIILYEFILYFRTRTSEPLFELTEVLDLKNLKGLMSEKKVFYGMGGWQYRPTFHYHIYDYTLKNKREIGNSFKFPNIRTGYKNVTEYKVNEYFTLDLTEINKLYINYKDLQIFIEQDPTEIELLSKAGFYWIIPRRKSKEKVRFIIKNQKYLGSYKQYTWLSEFNNFYKIYNTYKNTYNIKQIVVLSKEISRKINISEHNGKTIKRIMNLINSGMDSQHIHKLKNACSYLKLDFNKEIFRGEKQRLAIINTEELKRAEERQLRIYRVNTEIYQKEKKNKKQLKTLIEVTTKFKEFELQDIIFKPLKSMEDFVTISNSLELCLIQNEYYKSVAKEEKVLYLAQPKNESIKQAEVIEFYWKGKFKVGQVNGLNNNKSPLHNKIYELANTFTKEDLLNV